MLSSAFKIKTTKLTVSIDVNNIIVVICVVNVYFHGQILNYNKQLILVNKFITKFTFLHNYVKFVVFND